MMDVQTGLLKTPDQIQGDRTWQVLRPLDQEEFKALKSGIAEDGVVSSVVFDADWNIVDGYHRLRAWRELLSEGVEIPPVPYQRRIDLRAPDDTNRIKLLARTLNLQRRQLSQAERRDVVADQLRETPERSDQWIADDLGVHFSVVQKLRLRAATPRSEELADPELLPRETLGRDTKWRPYQPRLTLEQQIEETRRKAEAEAKRKADAEKRRQEQVQQGDLGAQTLGEAGQAGPGPPEPPPGPDPNARALTEILGYIDRLMSYDMVAAARTKRGSPERAAEMVQTHKGVMGKLGEFFKELEQATYERQPLKLVVRRDN
jgi:ParB-like chromosome segregation protein Spo0J